MKNFLRYFSIILSNDKGETLDLSEQRCIFKVEQPQHLSPRVANFSIYNLSSETSAKVRAKEFSQITVNAGYQQNRGLIFSGEIVYSVMNRENQVDIVTTIQCVDGNRFYTAAILSKTIASGYQQADIYHQIQQSYQQQGIKAGLAPQFAKVKMPRGKVMFGMARDYLNALSSTNSSTFYVENGEMMLIPKQAYLGEAVLLNAKTGLIGMPQQTIDGGVNLRCLINPLIKMNSLINIDLKAIYQAQQSSDLLSSPPTLSNTAPSQTDEQTQTALPACLATDGYYVVKHIELSGDTRGNDWYMDIICFAKGNMALYNQDLTARIV